MAKLHPPFCSLLPTIDCVRNHSPNPPGYKQRISNVIPAVAKMARMTKGSVLLRSSFNICHYVESKSFVRGGGEEPASFAGVQVHLVGAFPFVLNVCI